jgi:HAD superfamily hydrolase (TIGR01509 family)
MIRALLFDFDGLILDTESPIYQSWQEIYRSYGLELPLSSWEKIIGTAEILFDPFIDLQTKLQRPLNIKYVEDHRLHRETNLILAQPIMAGVMDYLSDARRLGLKTAIASSSNREWVTGHLERLQLLDFFDCIRTSDDVRNTKPDPELYLSALSCLDLNAEQAIVFEDSPNGILAAKRAGVFAIAVPNRLTNGMVLDRADMRLASLKDIPLEELIKRVSGEKGTLSRTG